LVAIPGLVVTCAVIFPSQKKGPPFLGRRPFGVAATSNSRPSGAQGRKTVKISIELVAYQFTVKLRTDIKFVLRSSFLAGSTFLLFFTGFAVGFIALPRPLN
jgi:hypothetical protein